MRGRKRGADAFTGLLNAKGKTSIDEGETAVSSDEPDADIYIPIGDVHDEELKSILQKSVVLLTLSNGIRVLSGSAGIAIQCKTDSTKFMTTSALLDPLYDKIEDPDNLKIEVHHNGVVQKGILEEYDLNHKLAVVSVCSKFDIFCATSNDGVPAFPGRDRKAVVIFGDTAGLWVGTVSYESRSKRKEWNMGEPLMRVVFSSNGSFGGLYLGSLLSRHKICELWQILRNKEKLKRNYIYPDACQYVLNKSHDNKQYCFGYPMPPRGGLILVNTFEEPFGDVYPEGVWSEFQGVSSRIDQNVVSLASFNGKKRLFCCSGVFIDFDENCATVLTSASMVRHPERPMEIVEGMKIEVLLPSKKRVEGMLKHCSLRYNVALIIIKNYRAQHTVNLHYKMADMFSAFRHACNFNTKLIAVGRSFESGVLMAASGNNVSWSGSLHHELLYYSSCKITKAGIGGPVFDLDGNFIGMNFYDHIMGTPFMLSVDLCGILNYFKTKETTYFRGFEYLDIVPDGLDKNPVRWPVIEPCWCHPDSLKKKRLSLRERQIMASGRPYTYHNGIIASLK